jgi:predicted flap endonuclease-1-like 5' DNA nuclease
MLHKTSIGFGLALTWLATSASTAQDQPTGIGLSSWTVLAILILIVFAVAIMLIFQRRKTPETLARYHLDHETHPHEDERQAAPVEPAIVEEISDEPPAAVIEEARLAEAPIQSLEPDDLTQIEGIGPKISEILRGVGITRFDQLAASDVETLHGLLKEAGPRFALADPVYWPEQAGYLAAGDMEKFKALNDRLRGGRKLA